MLDLKAGEQRYVIAVAFDTIDIPGHDRIHEGTGLIVYFVGIDENFADFGVEVIADGANDQTAFQINQEGAALLLCRAFDGGP